jgi:hypothetical protein
LALLVEEAEVEVVVVLVVVLLLVVVVVLLLVVVVVVELLVEEVVLLVEEGVVVPRKVDRRSGLMSGDAKGGSSFGIQDGRLTVDTPTGICLLLHFPSLFSRCDVYTATDPTSSTF